MGHDEVEHLHQRIANLKREVIVAEFHRDAAERRAEAHRKDLRYLTTGNPLKRALRAILWPWRAGAQSPITRL